MLKVLILSHILFFVIHRIDWVRNCVNEKWYNRQELYGHFRVYPKVTNMSWVIITFLMTMSSVSVFKTSESVPMLYYVLVSHVLFLAWMKHYYLRFFRKFNKTTKQKRDDKKETAVVVKSGRGWNVYSICILLILYAITEVLYIVHYTSGGPLFAFILFTVCAPFVLFVIYEVCKPGADEINNGFCHGVISGRFNIMARQ